MIFNLNRVCSLTGCISLLFAMVSCSKKDDAQIVIDKEQIVEEALQKARAEREALELKLAEEKEEARKAEERALDAELLLAEQLRKKQEAEEKVAAEKERVRLEKISKKQLAQKLACDNFVNTKYDELLLMDGKKLLAAKVTRAGPLDVSFIHRYGVTCVKYSNLPKEIGIACKYEDELAAIERERVVAVKQDARVSQFARAKNRVAEKETNSYSNPQISKYKGKKNLSETLEKKVVRPKGNLTVKVVGSQRGNKTINVMAKSNVDCILYLNDWYYLKYRVQDVKANQAYKHVWRRVSNKYEVKLVAKDSGKILDRESSTRKSGLGTSGGL